MPKQHRWTIKRNLDFAIKNCDLAIDNVAKAGHEFEFIHPEYYEGFTSIAKILDFAKDSITALRDKI